MAKKRIIKYSCLCLSIICAMFLCASAVFAASKQESECSVTVDYAPTLKAVVEVSVDGGSPQVVFNNTGTGTSTNSTYFSLSSTVSSSLSPSNSIVFTVTNYTTTENNKATSISAVVRLANSDTLPSGVDVPTNVYLCYGNNNSIANNSITISSSIATNASASSSAFYVQTLFTETVIPFIVELTLVSTS